MLRSWLRETSLEEFLETCFQREPIARPGTAGDAVPLFTWSTVTELVSGRPRPDVLVVKDGRLCDDRGPATGDEALELFRAGFSLVIRGCERHQPALADLAEGFAAELPGDVSIQVCATPAGHHGFAWRYDCEDVFIAQTCGVTRYLLRENTVNPRPTRSGMPRDLQFEKETSETVEKTLVPGDWLYVPRGFWHHAFAERHSLSIAVAVLSAEAAGAKPLAATRTGG